MTSEKVGRKEKNQNIQVFVRLRPLNQRERDIKSLGVIEVVNNREVVVKQSQQTSLTKKFTFDRAFNPHAKQVEVYQDVVSPLIEEVLAGYNCTVFAYGQTGTGKTHTMVGEHSGDETTWQSDPLAGIIPRALSQLFDELRISNTEYTVRVSYLELYNEELFDLLSTSEDNSKLRIYEDVTRKGSNIVNGLEEITVYNKNEVYKIMAQGQERKRVASTLMNAQSSRSHTVFTIVVHMKENSPEGEELVKVGKLNLVDLAGSENISKAGSDNPAKRERARECVNINQSLLTLGRVITALVERHPHIPYRESKLTRILQESLGGRTKTSIIATISPGHKDLEETMSTLEYAHRAKNIQNKPEINQKMTKKAILKEFAEEIDRLKRDLQAARDRNGVYLANETFTEMTLKQEEQRKEIQELLLKKRAMEEEREKMEGVFGELKEQVERTHCDLFRTKEQLHDTTNKLMDTDMKLRTTRQRCEEQRHLVEVQRATEAELSEQARALLRAADAAASHAARLHDAVDKRRSVEAANLEVTRAYRAQSAQQRAHLTQTAASFADALNGALARLQTVLDNYIATSTNSHEESKSKLEELMKNFLNVIDEMRQSTQATSGVVRSERATQRDRVRCAAEARSAALKAALEGFLQTLAGAVDSSGRLLARGDVVSFVNQWQSGASERVRSVRGCASRWGGERRRRDVARRDVAARAHRTRRDDAATIAENAHLRMRQIKEEQAQLESRLSKQLEDLELERRESKERLNAWAEEERRLLEERIARHVDNETQALETRLSKKAQEIEEERKLLEERMQCQLEWQQQQVSASEEAVKRADELLAQYYSTADEAAKCDDKFAKALDEGTSAVSIDMEVFTKNISDVTEHVAAEISRMLREAKELAEHEAEKLITTDTEALESHSTETDAAFEHICSQTTQALEASLQATQSMTDVVSETLRAVATSLSTVNAATSELSSSQRAVVEGTRGDADGFVSRLRDIASTIAALQDRYLANDYRQYAPTGGTPVRAEYRYPRQLAATSPHDSILRRYRAARNHCQEDECVVVESEEESPGTSECTTPECEPIAPPPPIFKSTSESDIYARRKQQEQPGKENADRSISYKRPSKLPAPASLKKPLVERNAAN